MELKDISYKYRRVSQLKRWHISMGMKNVDSLYYGQLHLLEYIISHPECSQKDIADRFALSKATVTKSVKRMIKNGIITRVVNPEDERKFMLKATEKGNELSDSCINIFKNVDELTFKDFSEEEVEQFSNYLDRIMENLETDYSRNKSLRELIIESDGGKDSK